MTSAEYGEWLEFQASEPIGHARGDVQAAIVACAAANAMGARSRPADYLPEWEPAQPPTPEQLVAALRRAARG